MEPVKTKNSYSDNSHIPLNLGLDENGDAGKAKEIFHRWLYVGPMSSLN